MNATMIAAGETVPGVSSDEAKSVLATGRSDISTIFLSLSARDPDGRDAEYLRWHTLDHRPEQYRLPQVRAAIRIVSTPECRAARAAEDPRLAGTDHVMTYFFTDAGGLQGFNELAVALGQAGRMEYRLPSVQRGPYAVGERRAAQRVKVGSDVLPWLPAKGVYLLAEIGDAGADGLTDIPGVAGLWQASAMTSDYSNALPGQKITYLFLDGDPVETARCLRPVLDERWRRSGIEPLLAAPFYATVPHEWDRYLP